MSVHTVSCPVLIVRPLRSQPAGAAVPVAASRMVIVVPSPAADVDSMVPPRPR